MDLASGIVTGYEALSRFPSFDGMPPDLVFAEAHRAGAGHDLETLALSKAIELGAARPANTGLSLNVSPSTLLTRQFMDVLPADLAGLQIEITEHEKITDKESVLSVLRLLRRRGATIAVDDLGEGYAGLQQLMMLEPDVLKLDRSLVTRAHEHPAKAALIEAISRYALRTGTRVCAEGAECLEELRLLADLDVGEAQGWVIGRPATTFEQADKAARRACISALSMILEVGDATEAGDPDLAGVLSRIATTESLDELARLMGWVSALLGCAKTALSLCDPADADDRGRPARCLAAQRQTLQSLGFPAHRRGAAPQRRRAGRRRLARSGRGGVGLPQARGLRRVAHGARLQRPAPGGPDRVLLDRRAPLDAPPDQDHPLRRGRHRPRAAQPRPAHRLTPPPFKVDHALIGTVRIAAGQSPHHCRCPRDSNRPDEAFLRQPPSRSPRASRRPSAGRGTGAARRPPGPAPPYHSRCRRPAARARRPG